MRRLAIAFALLMLAVPVMGATPAVVPRADDEGTLGNSTRDWSQLYVNMITITNRDGSVVLDGTNELFLSGVLVGTTNQLWQWIGVIADTGSLGAAVAGLGVTQGYVQASVAAVSNMAMVVSNAAIAAVAAASNSAAADNLALSNAVDATYATKAALAVASNYLVTADSGVSNAAIAAVAVVSNWAASTFSGTGTVTWSQLADMSNSVIGVATSYADSADLLVGGTNGLATVLGKGNNAGGQNITNVLTLNLGSAGEVKNAADAVSIYDNLGKPGLLFGAGARYLYGTNGSEQIDFKKGYILGEDIDVAYSNSIIVGASNYANQVASLVSNSLINFAIVEDTSNAFARVTGTNIFYLRTNYTATATGGGTNTLDEVLSVGNTSTNNIQVTRYWYTFYANASNYVYHYTPNVLEWWLVSVSNDVATTNIAGLR